MKNRITLGILFACIIGIAGGCSPSETKPVNLENRDMKSANQISSEIDGQWTGVVNTVRIRKAGTARSPRLA